MKNGRCLTPPAALTQVRARTLATLARLPEGYRALRDAPAYPVVKSAMLERLLEQVRERYLGAPQATNDRRPRGTQGA